jgi:pimeloyl-ACP methyl ester carboxylesterase
VREFRSRVKALEHVWDAKRSSIAGNCSATRVGGFCRSLTILMIHAREVGLHEVVYAKAMQEPRPSTPDIIVGGWQTDAGAHPQVDDEAYLDRIVLDLARRGVIGGGNEVWLVGAGSGAVMALSAAAHHPERYAGVAALMAERLDALPAGGLSGSRLAAAWSGFCSWSREVPQRRGEPSSRPAARSGRSRWARPRGAHRARRAPCFRLAALGSGSSISAAARGARRACASSCSSRASMRFHRRAVLTPCRSRPRAKRPGAVNGAEEVWRYLGGD